MAVDGTPTASQIGLKYNLNVTGVSDPISVNLMFNLSQGQILMTPTVDFRSDNISLREFVTKLGNLNITSKSSFMDNNGHGVLRSPPSNHNGGLPQSMQLMALYGPRNVSGNETSLGVYFATHDKDAN